MACFNALGKGRMSVEQTHFIECDEGFWPEPSLDILDMESKAASQHHEVIDNTQANVEDLKKEYCWLVNCIFNPHDGRAEGQ